MSYTFTNGYFAGDLGAGVAYPITIGAWVKYTNHPAAVQGAVALGTSASADTNRLQISTSATDGAFSARSKDATTNSTALSTTANAAEFDATWVAVVGVWRSASDRQIYVSSRAYGTFTNGTTRALDTTPRYFRIGGNLGGGEDWTGLIAEVAIWSADLSATTADIDAYMAGSAPAASIDNANLLAYYSLATDDDTPADESGNAGPTLSLSGTADYAADHPTITSLTTYVKLLAPSDAVGETAIEGVVLNAARDTVIGEFTGQEFVAGTGGDSGFAVLKIDVADITPNGSTLTTSDAPLVIAKNATYGTVGHPAATVIEE